MGHQELRARSYRSESQLTRHTPPTPPPPRLPSSATRCSRASEHRQGCRPPLGPPERLAGASSLGLGFCFLFVPFLARALPVVLLKYSFVHVSHVSRALGRGLRAALPGSDVGLPLPVCDSTEDVTSRSPTLLTCTAGERTAHDSSHSAGLPTPQRRNRPLLTRGHCVPARAPWLLARGAQTRGRRSRVRLVCSLPPPGTHPG